MSEISIIKIIGEGSSDSDIIKIIDERNKAQQDLLIALIIIEESMNDVGELKTERTINFLNRYKL